ncbi:MAG: hypothetical protein FJ276_17810, partial [Planctomycetes bacterium]|nr:hypothetical protein [Planctomycetota bacterium]
SDSPSPHPFFVGDALYVMPRVAAPAASCQVVEPRTGKLLDQFSLGVIGSCTRLTVTPSQFFYRPGGGEGRTVYVDLATRTLAEYEGIVRPGCFDGVVPAYGRLYWMPLACDCWQVHGTFSMAPRAPVLERRTPPPAPAPWSAPRSEQAAAKGDWPMFRANAAGTATVAANVPRNARMLWERRVPGGTLTAPTSANGRVYVGGVDGTVTALSQANGELLWQVSTQAAVNFPPAYWNGRVVFGSCDGVLYCVDAMDGRILGKRELAPEKRFVNIMDRLVSAWPLGGGVVLDEKGVVFAAAGSTAADGTVVAALDAAIGRLRWRQTYSLDRKDPMLSFGVQANILLDGDTLFVNGGAPVGIVALDATTGASPRVAAKLEAGMEMFLEPDGNPICRGPELYGHVAARTTIFKRHQGRAYFPLADRRVALVDGRLFCARDAKTLDLIVDLMNQDPNTGGRLTTEPRDVMQVPLNDAILWAGKSADVCGLAVATDGVIALCGDRVEAISPEGELWWTVPLPAAPVRWGLALSNKACHVTLRDGRVLCLGSTSATGGKPGS